MTTTLITGIGELVTCDGTGPDLLGIQPNAAVVVEGDGIVWIGAATRAPAADTAIDVGGRSIIPGFVDSHSHLVFAGDRGSEFAARMTGQPYDGGGIGVTVAATRAASDDELTRLLAARIAELRKLGTTTIEIKSGYGLTVADEVRALQIAGQFTTETTLLGAHVVPTEYAARRAAYVDLVTGPMLTAAAPYARWIDVFCEPHSQHAFDADEARQCLPPERRQASACGCTAISSGPDLGFSSRSSSAPRASITAPISMTPMSTRWPQLRMPRWRRCFRESSSAPGRPIRTPLGCSPQVSRLRLRPIAIRDLLLELHAVGDLSCRARDGSQPGSGVVRGHCRLGEVAAAYRHRPAGTRKPRRSHCAGRSVISASGLSPWSTDRPES